MESSWKKKGIFILLLALPVLWGVRWVSGQFRSPSSHTYRVVAAYPHDKDAFTQGLLIHKGVMFEGTGQLGKSQLRQVDIKTGRVLKSVALPERFFGEGIAIAGDELFQLTWKNRICFVYDPVTLKLKRSVRYAGQGWGLTYDGKLLVMSDGSSSLRFLDPKTFRVIRRVIAKDHNKAVGDLNELEFINGEIWANVWYQDKIVRIDPKTGAVVGWVDLKGLKPNSLRFNREAVYNGIALDAANGKLYATGKNWTKLFELEIIPR